jgi:UDP-2,3-diacylglucosamine hydrolase
MYKNMAIKFISDIHLSPERKGITQSFIHYMKNRALTADALYILGDFFHIWIGDDAMEEWHYHITKLLREYVCTGRSLYVMSGNHDFCYGKKFIEETGCYLLEEPHVLCYQGQQILLIHGDMLCTEDKSYQRYKKIIRNKLVIKLLLALPLSCRNKLANSISKKSKFQDNNKQTINDLLNIPDSEVIKLMNQYQVTTLIHGHTHRPNKHNIALDHNKIGTRYVLGDWSNYGWDITIEDNQIELQKFDLYQPKIESLG